MKIRTITEHDIEQLVLIHKKTFTKEHFTANLSKKLLSKYLKEIINANKFNFLSEDENGRIVGFLIAGYNSETALQKFTSSNFFSILFYLIIYPKFLIEKIIEIIQKKMGIKYKSTESLRLYLIEVDLSNQNSGVGKKLLEYFENTLISQKIFSYGLSVRRKNLQAINFYEKNNFLKEFTNQKSVFFIKRLDSN